MRSPILHPLVLGILGAVVVVIVATPARAATCPRSPFRTSPMRIGDFTNILPLGNFNPPDHTIPTDHIYFALPEDANGKTAVKNVYAPGDITITSVSVSTYYQDITKLAEDYSLMFSACDQLTGRFGHLSSLTTALKARLTKWDSCQTYESNAVGNRIRSCTKQTSVKVKNGARIGTVGGKISHALDLWAYDTRVNRRSQFINPARYLNTGMFMTTCPVDYFTTGVRTTLRAMLGDYNVPRTKAPRCGTFWPDKAGTLRGNWFYGSAKDESGGWKKELALAYSNRDGTTGAISIGGVVASAGVHYFTSQTSGPVNRAFETVTPGRAVYCYQSDADASAHFLIQLVDAKTLKIEKQAGPCTAPYTFSKPTTYKR